MDGIQISTFVTCVHHGTFSKVGMHLVNLERMVSSKGSLDELSDQMKVSTSKILQLVIANEKSRQDVMNRTINGVEILIQALQYSPDVTVSDNVVQIFNELMQSSRRTKDLSNAGVSQALFTALVRSYSSSQYTNNLALHIHETLAQLGPKDKKFAVRARLAGALGITLNLIRNMSPLQPNLQHLLRVMKLYTSNSTNSQQLGKSGAVACMLKILSSSPKKQPLIIRLALDNFNNLTKCRTNIIKAVSHNGAQILLGLHGEWNCADQRNRQINLRKQILQILKQITSHKNGCKAFNECGGMKIVYSTCKIALTVPDLECLVQAQMALLRKCVPKLPLPLPNLFSAYSFSLPNQDSTGPPVEVPTRDLDAYGQEDEEEDEIDEDLDGIDDDNDTGGGSLDFLNLPRSGDRSQHSQPDDDDYDLLEDDKKGVEGVNPPQFRPREELEMYAKFCVEAPSLATSSRSSFGSIQDSTTGGGGGLESISRSSQDLATLPPIIPPPCPSGVTKQSPFLSPRVSLPTLASRSTGSLPSSRLNSEARQSNPVKLVRSQTELNVRSSSSSPSHIPNLLVHSASLISKSVSKLASTSATHRRINQTKSLSNPPTRSAKKNPVVRVTSADNNTCTLTSSHYDLYGEGKDPFQFPSPFLEPHLYTLEASHVKSACKFNKVAIPDAYGHVPPTTAEELREEKNGFVAQQRSKLFEDFERVIFPENVLNACVYDLDEIVKSNGQNHRTHMDYFDGFPTLKFASMFECGNLRRAIQVREREYDLILNTDVNTNHHIQWFYFEVSNMRADCPYRFNIVNCEKPNSQFNYGMQPLMYSTQEMLNGHSSWTRCGTDVAYYKNHLLRNPSLAGGKKGCCYFTCTFTVTFKYEEDIVYFAYHYPFSYSMLKLHLNKLGKVAELCPDILYRHDTLCQSLAGNDVPLLTITSNPEPTESLEDVALTIRLRPVIFLCARVHPGESNSSWIMSGTLNHLLSPAARCLRDHFVFKLLPMLNPDGVVNGHHRCSLSGEDLNRCWQDPSPDLHPTIYHAKGLLQYLYLTGRSPLVFCDYHGHSRKKNIFLYGCSNAQSWFAPDKAEPEDVTHKSLPRLLSAVAPGFAHTSCCFFVEKIKETTARVVIWREFKITRSYTMESTFSGFDQGSYKNLAVGTKELQEMGAKFCEALLKMKSSLDRDYALALGSNSIYKDSLAAAQDQFGPLDLTQRQLGPPSGYSDDSDDPQHVVGSQASCQRTEEEDEEEEDLSEEESDVGEEEYLDNDSALFLNARFAEAPPSGPERCAPNGCGYSSRTATSSSSQQTPTTPTSNTTISSAGTTQYRAGPLYTNSAGSRGNVKLRPVPPVYSGSVCNSKQLPNQLRKVTNE